MRHALRFSKGFAVSCALQFLGALAAVILTVSPSATTAVLVVSTHIHCVRKISYRNDNKRRDEKYGEPAQDEPVDTSELADKVRNVHCLPPFGRSCVICRPRGFGMFPDDLALNDHHTSSMPGNDYAGRRKDRA